MDCRHPKANLSDRCLDLVCWLTSGANCKFDFFFFQYKLCCYATNVCPPSTTFGRGITWYPDIMNSTIASVARLLRTGTVVDGMIALRQKAEQENGDNRRGLFGL